MNNQVVVPRLSASVFLETDIPFDTVVKSCQDALGVTFHTDLEGTFEELNALVADVLMYTIGIYTTDNQGVYPPQREIFIDLRSLLSLSYCGLSLEQCQRIHIRCSEFLARLLERHTGLAFRPNLSITEERERGKKIIVPHLRAWLKLESSLSLVQIAARVGAALGVNFSDIVGIGRDDSVLDGYWYMCEANAFSHIIKLYADVNPYATPLPRRILFELQPASSIDTSTVSMTQYETLDLVISDIIGIFMKQETDLLFVPAE